MFKQWWTTWSVREGECLELLANFVNVMDVGQLEGVAPDLIESDVVHDVFYDLLPDPYFLFCVAFERERPVAIGRRHLKRIWSVSLSLCLSVSLRLSVSLYQCMSLSLLALSLSLSVSLTYWILSPPNHFVSAVIIVIFVPGDGSQVKLVFITLSLTSGVNLYKTMCLS